MLTPESVENFLSDFDEQKHVLMISTFHKSMVDYKDSFTKAIEEQDSYVLENAAHSLKSAARMIGASELADLAETIEHKVKSNEDEAAFSVAPNIFSDLEQSIAILDNKLKEIS